MKLYIVPTPIGNLKDITLRSLEILQKVDYILCEDTRTSSVFLNHYQIQKKLLPFHQHNEHSITPKIISFLQAGSNIALITDAGTPGISDPSYLLVKACITNQIPTECLPGATAFVPALVNSGIPSNRFCFEGFLPLKKGRQTLLKKLSEEERTIIFYETPKKIFKTISDLLSYFEPERNVCIGREISKMYEDYIRGTLIEIKQQLEKKELKGELVCILEGTKKNKKINTFNLNEEE